MAECVILIEGMTSQSYVYMIENELSDLDGILEAKVSLENKNAYIKYNNSITCPNEIIKMINTLSINKFRVKLVSLPFIFIHKPIIALIYRGLLLLFLNFYRVYFIFLSNLI
jgi:copper chaperone CopZ